MPQHNFFFRQQSFVSRITSWVAEQVWIQKLNNPFGLALLLLLTLPFAWLLAQLDIKVGFLTFIVLMGLPMLVFTLINLPFAIGLMLLVSVVVVFGAKFTSAPLGTLLDLLVLLSAVGVLLRQIKERNWAFAKHPMSYMVLIWLYYNFLQILNPEAQSTMAWLYTVRSIAIQQLVFFIAAYAFKDNKKAIFNIIKLIIGICFFGTLFGLKQQYIGFFAAETSWIMADKLRFELYYQWGMMRIPSFCYDPTTFGILAACFAVFCTTLIFGPTSRKQKILLSIMLISALWVMAFTGTRTAFALVPVGAIFYAGLILNRRVFLIGSIMAIVGVGFVLKSTSSGVIYRIQSAFRPTEDASMNLRLENQRKIQPYIQSHPMGGGLGSCGIWGKRFNPDSELSDFPHDSSFVRMAVELGWIGLILYTLLHYAVLRTGLYYFVRCQDKMIKAIYAGVTTWCFMLAVACYAQEAILQLPMNGIYNTFLAILITLKNFDPAFQEPHNASRG